MNTYMTYLYAQDQFPIFQNRTYDSRETARSCSKGDIRLIEDLTTGLIYNAAFRPELVTYDMHYNNEQAVSGAFRQHLDAVASLIEKGMGRNRLVEVGCGKGFFLEKLAREGFDISGFDPAYEGDNPRIQRRYFEPGVIESAEGLILRHVLEHIQNPVDFLRRLRDANGGAGRVYIEVPCFDWICRHRSWFDVFYEHVNYFRLSDFQRIFKDVVDIGRVFNDQYLYVVAELASIREPQLDETDRVVFPENFMPTLADLVVDDRPITLWGGASKGVIFALLSERAGRPVARVIDINPAKQGKYLAATGLQVTSPEDARVHMREGDPIYVMNPNYLEEIKLMFGDQFNYKVMTERN